MAYEKADVVAFGQAIGDLIVAVTDGVSTEDLAQFIAAVTAGAATVNEFEEAPAAGAVHTLSAAGDKVGDWLLTK